MELIMFTSIIFGIILIFSRRQDGIHVDMFLHIVCIEKNLFNDS